MYIYLRAGDASFIWSYEHMFFFL